MLSIGAACYLLRPLCSRITEKSLLITSHHQKPETILEPIIDVATTSDLRALLPSTEVEPQPNKRTQCGHIFHRKSRLSDSTISNSIGMDRQVVMESRKGLYCYIGRIGSSRWRRLALKSEGVASHLDLPGDQIRKMLAMIETSPPLPVFFYNSLVSSHLGIWHTWLQ